MTRSRPVGLPLVDLDRRKVLSLLLVPSYIVIIAVLYGLDGTAAFPAPILLLLLNAAFLGVVPLYVAYVSFVSFGRSGLTSLLMMGGGMLFLGLGSIVAGLAGLLPGTTNLAVTVFNLAACAGAVLQFAGALTALIGWTVRPAERRRALAATAYAGVVLIFAGILIAAAVGLTPAFFVPGAGSTSVRDVVLGGAVESLLLASALFFVLYRKRDEDFFFWYSVGMAMIGLGLIAATFIAVFDGPLNWAARIGEYLGACYILVAFLALERRASRGNVPVQEMLATFFAEAEAEYRLLVETAADAIVVLDPAYRVLLWNTAAERLFGYGSDEAVGMSFSIFVPGVAAILGARGDLADSPVRRELEAWRRDKTVVPIELMASQRTVAGQVISTCIIHDLTERKQAEAALRESEARYRLALTNAPTVLFSQDRDLRYTWAGNPNPGFTGPTILGATDADLFPPEEAERLTALKRQVLETGTTLRAEVRTTINGVTYDYDLTLEPLTDERGETAGVLGVSHDITELKHAEEALERYARELERSNEELQRFAYVASHDLQEPLRSIVSFSQLLERRYRGKLGQDADEYIAFIVEGGSRMQALIRDLLQFSRIGTAARPLAPTQASEVVADVLRAMETPLREAGATVTVDDLPGVMADRAQLEQVFTNLISNAIKYRHPDRLPGIRVSGRRTEGMVEFSVADNGIGIEAEYYDRIFEMFRRLHTHDQYEGTGIGLAVVKKIVERHGGTVRVESVPGEGSTFYFTLPAV